VAQAQIARGAIYLTTDYSQMAGGLRRAEGEAAAAGKRIGAAVATATRPKGQPPERAYQVRAARGPQGQPPERAYQVRAARGPQGQPPERAYQVRAARGPQARRLDQEKADALAAGVRGSFKAASAGKDHIPTGRTAGYASALGAVATAATPAAAGVAAVAAGVVAAGAAVAAAVPRIKELAATARTGRALGLDPQAFGGIAAAAARFEVDQKALLEGLVDMSGRAADALSNGTGVMGQAFASLKLDPKQFQTLGIERQLYTLTDALAAMPDAGERARLTLKFFGEDVGKQLLPLVVEGGAGIRRLADEARAAGVVLTADQQGRVDAAAAAVARAEAVLQGGWNKLAAAVAPLTGVAADALSALQPVLDWAARAITPVATFGAAVARAVGQAVAAVAGWAGQSLGVERWPTVEAAVTSALRGVTEHLARTADQARATAGMMSIGFGSLLGVLADVVGGLGRVAAAAANASSAAAKALKYGAAAVASTINPTAALALATLPTDLVGPAAEAAAKAAEAGMRRAADAATAWGRTQVGAWGQWTAQAMGWFARVMEAKKQADAPAKPKAKGKDDGPGLWKGNEALAAGSKAAVSAEIRATVGGLGDRQLAEQRRANDLLRQHAGLLKALVDKPLTQFGVL
jgi:hypothetical protein